MLRQIMKNWITFLGPLAVVALMSSAGFAQEEEKPFVEPGLIMAPTEKPIIQWLAASLFIVGCVGIAFKHPRRSHLD
ncbi:MAG: hypothetical protein JNG88_09015 [Phycisphaerales bacterium]|nr:hypothetical protein [Phycisphaerales bacterium]